MEPVAVVVLPPVEAVVLVDVVSLAVAAVKLVDVVSLAVLLLPLDDIEPADVGVVMIAKTKKILFPIPNVYKPCLMSHMQLFACSTGAPSKKLVLLLGSGR